MGSVTYKTELLPSMYCVHNVLHVSKLKKYKQIRDKSAPLDIFIDAEDNVEQILKESSTKKRENRMLKYLVRFEDQPRSESSWYFKSDIRNCKSLVQEYERSMRTSNFKEAVNVIK